MEDKNLDLANEHTVIEDGVLIKGRVIKRTFLEQMPYLPYSQIAGETEIIGQTETSPRVIVVRVNGNTLARIKVVDYVSYLYGYYCIGERKKEDPFPAGRIQELMNKARKEVAGIPQLFVA